MKISVYSKYPYLSSEIFSLCQFLPEKSECNLISAKSYRIHNYALENTDLLIIDNECMELDVNLVINSFKTRNVPVLFYTNEKKLLPDNYEKVLNSQDKDTQKLLKKYKKTYDNCYGVLTSNKALLKLPKPVIYMPLKKQKGKERKLFISNLNDCINNYKSSYGDISKISPKFDFAKKMQINNRKYRTRIFPHAMLDKTAMVTSLISYNNQYKKYILKMDYDELLKAYKEVKKNRQPEIFKKFSKKLLNDSRPERIRKMLLKICKNPEYPLEEVLFYIIKEIPSRSVIFKDIETLQSFIKEFCDLSYVKNIDDEIIFRIKDFDKKTNIMWDTPDTYNIRQFLISAYKSKNHHKVLFKLLELCAIKKVSKEELDYESYLLKTGLTSPEIVDCAINKNYIKHGRIYWSKFTDDDLNLILKGKTAKNQKIRNFIKSEKIFIYEPRHFFIRIKGYGKNINWGRSVAQLTDKAAVMIKNHETYDTVLGELCFYTRQNALNNPNTDKTNMSFSGQLRYICPESCRNGLVTGYTYNSRYGGRYSKLFKKFKDPKKALKSPYKDMSLTRIKVSKKDELSGKMHHVTSEKTVYCLKYIEQIYNDLIQYTDKNYTKTEYNKIVKQIAKLHWIIAHNAPWGRGSDSIANIFIKAILKSLNIKVDSLKPNISLDLEAFCTELKDYQKNYPNFYEQFEHIKIGV